MCQAKFQYTEYAYFSSVFFINTKHNSKNRGKGRQSMGRCDIPLKQTCAKYVDPRCCEKRPTQSEYDHLTENQLTENHLTKNHLTENHLTEIVKFKQDTLKK